MVFNRQSKTVQLGHNNTILRHIGLCNRKEDKIHGYLTKETHGNFTEDCLGEAEGSAATQDFS